MKSGVKIFLVLFVVACFSTVFAQGHFPVGGSGYASGQVTFEGKPIAGVKVTAIGENGVAMAMNASNGNYALGLAKGEWAISASKEGYAPVKPVKVTIGDKEYKENLNIQLKKFNSYIRGKVVDESGNPIQGAYVLAAPVPSIGADDDDGDSPEGDGDDMDPSSITPSFVESAQDGSFTLLVDKGNYLLMANKIGYEMSSKNPPAKIPGLENSPVRLPGIMLKLKTGEQKDGVVIILAPAKSGENKPGSGKDLPGKPTEIAAVKNILIGKDCVTPNNVLHWTRETDNDKIAFYVIQRTVVGANGKPEGEAKKFDFMSTPYGYPASSVFSFTDNTAEPGKSYEYTVQELGTKGAGPVSNPVVIKTR
ncbi:MAG: carboxypeptidase-like regulatory domain-containing protein [Firmicutes bacterium]|nr:carboxypeptidase-like regulatory domain-containing protein [Bacillota bacterium]